MRCTGASVVVAVALVGAACDEPAGGPPIPDVISATVSLEKRGDGFSTVFSDPTGLTCDLFCDGVNATFDDEETVDLLVEPARDAQFVRAFCTSTGQQTVRADALDGTGRARLSVPTIIDGVGVDWRCVAELKQVHTLQVIVATGTGTGRVLGSLAASLTNDTLKRIDCPGDCVGGYFVDETETLTATPEPGSVFAAWNFCTDSIDPTIDVVMTGDANCEAIFDLAP